MNWNNYNYKTEDQTTIFSLFNEKEQIKEYLLHFECINTEYLHNNSTDDATDDTEDIVFIPTASFIALGELMENISF
jgi:hypothetical protein